jgi:cytochrome c
MTLPEQAAMKNLIAKCLDWNKTIRTLQIETLNHSIISIMKKGLLVLFIAAGIYACGGGATEGESKPVSTNEDNKNSQIGGEASAPATATAPATDAAAAAPVSEPVAAAAGKDGKALIAGSDCLTCHKEDAKLIGPAYKEVAKKYESNEKNIKMLGEKVLKGGQGVWGEIPMAGHPNLSQEDAEAMVKYILTLK